MVEVADDDVAPRRCIERELERANHMLLGNQFDRFAVETLLLQKLAQRGSDAVMVADGVGAYARVASVWISRETNPVLCR